MESPDSTGTGLTDAAASAAPRAWRAVAPGVWLFPDSCNVYAIEGPAGMLIVDAGTGEWLDHLDELPRAPAALALTHYFRDHAAGAVRAARTGVPVFVPEGEYAMLADPLQHFRERETYNIYDNIWDLFAPIEPIAVAGVLRDYERRELAGIDVEVVPLPGVTPTQIGLRIKAPDVARPMICCGEAISAPGRMARVAPLQYNYNDMLGSVNAHWSARQLRRFKDEPLLPSLGEPMLERTDAALEQLCASLKQLGSSYARLGAAFEDIDDESLVRVTDHVWHSPVGRAFAWFVISDSGKALCIDYGYLWQNTRWPAYPRPARRRPLLHALAGLKKQFGIDQIDVVLPTHFHDDHVCGIPLLQRIGDTQCWAPDNFADLLEHPEAHRFPCNWPAPMRIDRQLPLDEPVRWEEFTFHLAPMSGHTRFAALIGFEADGQRFAHTGDQYTVRHGTKDFRDNVVGPNHVYANGSLIDGYAQSGRWLADWRPDIVLTGHQGAIHTDAHFFRIIDECTERYQRLHRQVMDLDEPSPHLNADSWGGWIWPYRVHLAEAQPTTVTVTVRNPLPRRAELHVRLVGPEGWSGTETTLSAEPRFEVSCELQITPVGACRRQPFAAELTVEGQPYGQVAEAMMSVGSAFF